MDILLEKSKDIFSAIVILFSRRGYERGTDGRQPVLRQMALWWEFLMCWAHVTAAKACFGYHCFALQQGWFAIVITRVSYLGVKPTSQDLFQDFNLLLTCSCSWNLYCPLYLFPFSQCFSVCLVISILLMWPYYLILLSSNSVLFFLHASYENYFCFDVIHVWAPLSWFHIKFLMKWYVDTYMTLMHKSYHNYFDWKNNR